MSQLLEIVKDMQSRQIRMEEEQREILIQTTKTNGQVAVLKQVVFNKEDGLLVEVDSLKSYRSKQRGIWMAVLIVCGSLSTISMIILGILTLVDK